MAKEFTRNGMLEWLIKHYKKNGYKVTTYSKEFLPARVAFYCKKKSKDGIVDEIIVEPTIDDCLSVDSFFPELRIPKIEIPKAHPVIIPGASPVRFYQYYFPNAKIFLAFPEYVKEDEKYLEFIEFCKARTIGLLKISKSKIVEISPPCSLFNNICTQLTAANGNREKIENAVDKYLESNLHYLVYYPDPVYRRRAITGRDDDTKGVISFYLIDQQQELVNVTYKQVLKKLATKYRQEADNDFIIAEKCIKHLWNKYLGLEYPNIQSRVESILQRNESYREHFVHQFQVFLIGAYILDSIYPEVAKGFEKKYKCKIENAWLAASTFHDFNYGLQNFDTWLRQFFEDSLRVKNKRTKENINLLNLDSAMIREALFDKIVKLADQLKNDYKENERELMIRFFYEKAVRDRNHGVLSAISLIKLFDECKEGKRLINMDGILQAAIAIECHDEDIWESLCGCQGYRRSPGNLPSTHDECNNSCSREPLLWQDKKSRIFKDRENGNSKCESWESEFMQIRAMDKIKFEDYPILFLLIFCDSIQDEGRFTSSGNTNNQDLSKLTSIAITKDKHKIMTSVALESLDADKKLEELERVSWCLKDDRFRVSINGTVKVMNGNGGG